MKKLQSIQKKQRKKDVCTKQFAILAVRKHKRKMKYGICNLPAIAMRKEARHTAEMVSQLLYNETYSVIDKSPGWLLVKTGNVLSSGIGISNYEGWIQEKQFHEMDEDMFNTLNSTRPYLINKAVAKYRGFFLGLGTPLYEPHPDAVMMPEVFLDELMVENAKKMLNAPYLWGGRTVMGIDCSGLVQLCARMSGITLPRDAKQQALCGDIVYFLQETQPGDLAFFCEEGGPITHVGILIGNEQIIHASGQVRIDYLDQTGIFNKELDAHTHRLQAVKRMR